MATKKTAAEQGLQQKMKVLAKLFDAGCKTEKDLKALTLPTILKIPDVTVPDEENQYRCQKGTGALGG